MYDFSLRSNSEFSEFSELSESSDNAGVKFPRMSNSRSCEGAVKLRPLSNFKGAAKELRPAVIVCGGAAPKELQR